MSVTPSLEAAKRELRRRLVAQRRALGADVREAASLAACARIATLPEWREARTVAIYAAHRGELDPAGLFAHREGRRLLFPVVEDGDPILRFFRVDDPARLSPGAYGILAPTVDPAAELPLDAIDLFVVPGVAFDAEGHRLGLGGGYYDATLPLARRQAPRLGFAHAFQVVAAVPHAAHDVRVDLVVTEGSVLRVAGHSDTKR